MRTTRHRIHRTLAVVSVLALVATACLGEEGDGGAGGDDGNGNGNGNGAAGGEVSVLSAFTGDEADLFRESFAAFEEESGYTVDYESAQGFETIITTRVQGQDAPDIALFPQPGLLMDIQEQTDAIPLADFLDIDQLEQNLIPGFLDATTDDEGNAYGLPMRMAVKSIIWYPIPQFEEAGYELPETQAELLELEEQIRSDGATPWCLGMEAGESTGWVATDWVEEYMLRLHGPELYDEWVEGELAFDSPEVTEAFEEFGRVWQTDGNVVGGSDGVINIPFGDSPNDMFQDEPGCYLHRQGNFITGFFPDDVQEDLDNQVGAAYFPPDETGFDGSPVLAGGDLALMINDTEPARAFMEFMADPTFGEPWAEAGGWLSPNVEFDESAYPDEVTRDVYRIGADADILRYDASDSMPGAVGSGTFWSASVEWISGSQDVEATVQQIEQSWPDSG